MRPNAAELAAVRARAEAAVPVFARMLAERQEKLGLAAGWWTPFVMIEPLPSGWKCVEPPRLDGAGAYVGTATYREASGLMVISSACVEDDLRRWLHVSVSRRDKLPSWFDLKRVKDVFVGADRTALQVLAKADEHVNLHPFCLHLWCCLDGDAVPDFTRGLGTV